MSAQDQRWARAKALPVAERLRMLLAPVCVPVLAEAHGFVGTLQQLGEYCEIAGSLRRRKPDVGDIEIVFVPKYVPMADGRARKSGEQFYMGELLATPGPATDLVLENLLGSGCLAKRKNVLGYDTWGPENKYARDVETGIPVDLFATTEASWWNYLVCRTGPRELNEAIAKTARKRGWKWEPTSPGFVRVDEDGKWVMVDGKPERYWVKSEREVFEFAGLEYKEPWER